ncbi:hypothetical protein D9M71_661430 [compost metagenome]
MHLVGGERLVLCSSEVDDALRKHLAIAQHLEYRQRAARVGALQQLRVTESCHVGRRLCGQGYGLLLLLQHAAIEIHHPVAQLCGNWRTAIVEQADAGFACVAQCGHRHVGKEAARMEIQRLPVAEVIHAGPGRPRPHVIELPVQRTHRVRA